MNNIVFATSNKGKIREAERILRELGFEVQSMKDAGIVSDPEETGETFLENAFIKARAVHELTDAIVLADDSGLEIDALGKAPGVQSARYMGHDTSYDIKNAKILELLKDVKGEARSARYVCAIAAVLPDGRELSAVETMEGQIALKAAGERGFGYDPIFWVPEYNMTSAELTDAEKDAISHRGKALRAIKEKLKNELR